MASEPKQAPAIQVTSLNNVKVYNLSSGKSLNQFLDEAASKKQSLRYNTEYRNRIELIQDFEMPTASTRVRMSGDGSFVAVSGVYPPQVKIFELSELSLKCTRNLDAEIVQFQFLSDDYKKLAFLCDNRTLEFHAQYGKHYITRLPKAGRDMIFSPFNCDLYIAGSSNEIFRLNLEQGRFYKSLESSICSSFDVVALNSMLKYVLSTAGEDGVVEAWDLRDKSRAAVLDPNAGEVTALQYDPSGMMLGVGHKSGLVHVYDIRYNQPLHKIRHYNELPIHSVRFHTSYIMSADPKVVKISDKSNGELYTSIESSTDMCDLELVPQSGLLFTATEAQRVGTFFVPTLGPAPKWCSFLESITEELEETQGTTIYEDYKFVTYEDLENLNALSYIGTEHLQAHMHGYLMNLKLYFELRQLSQPFSFEEYRKQRVREKLEEKKAQRITTRRKLPKVNKELAQELIQNAESGNKKKQKEAASLLNDDRFSALFTNAAFSRDQASEDFKRLNSSRGQFKPEDEVIVPNMKLNRQQKRVLKQTEDEIDKLPMKHRLQSRTKPPQKRRKEGRKLFKEKLDTKGRRTLVNTHNLIKNQ